MRVSQLDKIHEEESPYHDPTRKSSGGGTPAAGGFKLEMRSSGLDKFIDDQNLTKNNLKKLQKGDSGNMSDDDMFSEKVSSRSGSSDSEPDLFSLDLSYEEEENEIKVKSAEKR